MTPDESAQVEGLLLTWFAWQCRQSHAEILAHYYRPTDMTCKRYHTPTTFDEDDESAYQWADDRQSEQVQLCVDQLSVEQRAAISVSLRNKELGASVWRSGRVGDQNEAYQAAKAALFPMLIARHLIRMEVEA